MYDNKFADSGSKLSTKSIAQIEKQLGCKLPGDYREFLLKHNGGCPNKSFFKQRGAEFLSSVDWLCTIDKSLAEPNHKSEYRTLAAAQARYAPFVPVDMLVIGRVDQDDPLLLAIRGRRKGKVFVKKLGDMDPVPDDELEKLKNVAIRQLAKSFSTFMESLDHSEDE